jgi:hypothetical protein
MIPNDKIQSGLTPEQKRVFASRTRGAAESAPQTDAGRVEVPRVAEVAEERVLPLPPRRQRGRPSEGQYETRAWFVDAVLMFLAALAAIKVNNALVVLLSVAGVLLLYALYDYRKRVSEILARHLKFGTPNKPPTLNWGGELSYELSVRMSLVMVLLVIYLLMCHLGHGGFWRGLM